MNTIKALIFDLDDTLIDTSGTLKDSAFRKAIKAMQEEDTQCEEEEALTFLKTAEKEQPREDKFELLAQKHGGEASVGREVYLSQADLSLLSINPEVESMLKELAQHYSLALITTGRKEEQLEKVKRLHLEQYFAIVKVNEKLTKEAEASEVKEKLGLRPHTIAFIGDKVDDDVLSANKLGMVSIRVKTGAYASVKPTSKEETPDYEINQVTELPKLLKDIEVEKNKLANGPKIVAMGGGTGCPIILEGLKNYTHNLTAIVTVTDRGRSSGKLHEELDVLPPGDVRNNLVALSDAEQSLHELFQYRFEEGELKGHSFGNLLLAALTKITGSFEEAIRQAGTILNLNGKVLPSTTEKTEICAELEDGTVLKGEQSIVVKGEDIATTTRPAIVKAWLEPEAEVTVQALQAIKEADLIVIGPGSLYTSVLPNLLLKGVNKALKETKAKKVYVCNIVTQAGQTENYSAEDHIKVIQACTDNALDVAVVNDAIPPKEVLASYEKEKAFLVKADNFLSDIRVVKAPIVADITKKKVLWEKTNFLRHSSTKIAEVLMNL